MSNNYIITSTGTFLSEDELYHYGVIGMKWGVRRYQNADGSLTDLGRRLQQVRQNAEWTERELARFQQDVEPSRLRDAMQLTSDVRDVLNGYHDQFYYEDYDSLAKYARDYEDVVNRIVDRLSDTQLTCEEFDYYVDNARRLLSDLMSDLYDY